MAVMKLDIYAFTNQELTDAADPSKYTLQVNPASMKYTKEILSATHGAIGGQYRAPRYSKHKQTSLAFDTVLDNTGVLDELQGGIDTQIEALENVVYNLNGTIHRPNYLKISWGTTIFQGILNSLNYEYSLFAPSGDPLRVKVSFSLTGFLCPVQAALVENKTSPDLSHLITIKAGDTIAAICRQIYGDPSFCADVARYNHLDGFRNVKPGTQLMFAPLK